MISLIFFRMFLISLMWYQFLLVAFTLGSPAQPGDDYPSFFDIEPIEGNEDTYLDDDDWDEPPFSDPGPNYNPAGYYPSDPCSRLCDEFSASNRGNGFDLCEEDQVSVCILDSHSGFEICTNLFWSLTEDNQPGLIFESGSVDATLRTLTCSEAEEIVFGNDNEPSPMRSVSVRRNLNTSNTTGADLSHWYSAVHIFTHLDYVQRAMSNLNRSPVLDLLWNYTSQFTAESDGSFMAPAIENILPYFGEVMQSPRVDLFLSAFNQIVLEVAGMIEAFMSDFVEDAECGNCGAEFHDAFLGPIRLPHINETLSIQEIVDTRFSHPETGAEPCQFCQHPTTVSRRAIGRIGRFLMLHFEEPQHVLISTQLHTDEDRSTTYQLAGISHLFPDGHYEADILINGQWFRAINQTVVPTTIVDLVELTNVSTLFYSRIQ